MASPLGHQEHRPGLLVSMVREEMEPLTLDLCPSNINPKNTMRATASAVRILRDYCHNHGHTLDFETLAAPDLATLLKEFYVKVRKKDGALYSMASLEAIRAGICRYVIGSSNGSIDIVKDGDFINANKAFKAQRTHLKQAGLSEIYRYPEISYEDLLKLYSPRNPVFDVNKPSGLQMKVFFEIMMYFRWKGRDDIRKMTKDTFALDVTSDGREYVYRTQPNALNDASGVMYEVPESPQCPVQSYKKYMSKLHPMCHFLWQHPDNHVTHYADREVWYLNSAVGHNSLGAIISLISKEGGLSQMYTTRSIQLTSVAILRGTHMGRKLFKINKDKRMSPELSIIHDQSMPMQHPTPSTLTFNQQGSIVPMPPSRVLQNRFFEDVAANADAELECTINNVLSSDEEGSSQGGDQTPPMITSIQESSHNARRQQAVILPNQSSQMPISVPTSLRRVKQEPAPSESTSTSAKEYYIEFDGKLHQYNPAEVDRNSFMEDLVTETFNKMKQHLPLLHTSLPPGWCISVKDKFIHIMKTANWEVPVITKSVTLNKNLEYTITIRNYILPKDHPLHQGVEPTLTNMDNVHKLIGIVENYSE